MLIFLKSASACCTTFAFAPVLYRCCIPWLQEYPPLDLMGNGPGGGPRTFSLSLLLRKLSRILLTPRLISLQSFSKGCKRFLLSTTGSIPLFCYKSHCLPDLSTLIFTTLALSIFSLLNIWTSPTMPCFLLPSIFAHMPPVF